MRRWGGLWIALAAAAVFAAIWFPVLVGAKVLIAGDVLYPLLPWSATAGVHAPRNVLLADGVLLMTPWQELVSAALRSGHMPLWNPLSLGGTPLLANDASAALSPFTLFAVPFEAARGLSLAMLLKLWVAGFGTAVFVRNLGARWPGAAVAGVAYATSSFMVVWLAWSQTGVAALLPWCFAAAEWYLRTRRRAALAALAAGVALQFLAGHAETSVHLLLGVAVYSLVRLAAIHRDRWRRLAGMVFAGAIGSLIAAIQILPFLDTLRRATVLGERGTTHIGSNHLVWRAAATWLVPNGHGNPGIDGRLGWDPNYNEATAFVGVTVVVLAAFGARWLWIRNRSAAMALSGLVLGSALVVYGPLSPLVGALPALSLVNNVRLIVLMCFALAVLGGLGFQALHDGSGELRRPRFAMLLTTLGVLALLGCSAGALVFLRRGVAVNQLLPVVAGQTGFWLAMALLVLLSALAFVAASRLTPGRAPALAGLVGLVLLEGALFAAPYNPLTPPNEVPPPSDAVRWLQAHAGDGTVAAIDSLTPGTAPLLGLHDLRGYDVTIDTRVHAFLGAADPGYREPGLHTYLNRPDPGWLAAAGVRYLMYARGLPSGGTREVFSAENVVIAEVPLARPFAFIARRTVTARDRDDAARLMARDPLGAVVLETPCCGTTTGDGSADVVSREPAAVHLRVTATEPSTLVLLQAYAEGWKATVDGRATAVAPADVMFQSVEVPSGSHDVRLYYAPVSVLAGAGLSAASLLALVGLWLWPRRPRPDPQGQ